MFPKKNTESPKRRNFQLSQLGLNVPDGFDISLDFHDGNDGSDSDLEAELAALSGGVNRVELKENIKVTEYKVDGVKDDNFKNVSINEEAVSSEVDSKLLLELQNIVRADLSGDKGRQEVPNSAETLSKTTDLSLADEIKQRIEMYKIAETNAEAAGEFARVRRLNRGLKTLNELLRQLNCGKLINHCDIPPAVGVKLYDNSSTRNLNVYDKVAEPIPSLTVTKETVPNENDSLATTLQNNPIIQQMLSRQQEYKTAALKCKRNGDIAMALQYIKIFKQFDVVIKMCEDGQDVDLSDMPPPPEHFKQFMENMLATSEIHSTTTQIASGSSLVLETASLPGLSNTNVTNILESLQQRLNKYKTVEQSAKAEGIASKARRYGRIVKQYEVAIKDHKAGRHVAYEELPIPPGFEQLPAEIITGQESPGVAQAVSRATSTLNLPTKHLPPAPQYDLTSQTSANQENNNLAEKQLKILLDRQKEFKNAAIDAKKAGEINQAREYLKMYKGFDALLRAARSGLPVDLNSLPVPPSQIHILEDSFAIITTDECDPNDDISDIGVRIEEQLAKQLMMCKNTRDHHKAMGDIAGMNRFENLALTVQKDLDVVRYSKRKNFQLPKFHYEQRQFHVVHCNTDLAENELEITVARGINYNVSNPKDVDTYVRLDFPLLNNESYKAKTNLIKDTDSPNYNQCFKIEITRGNRQFQRIFKRHAVKFEVYSRGGFLRSDVLIGTVNVKLQPLEMKCDIHDIFDLVEGRKKVGGKLEIKMRVRNPMLTKQIEQINEKWLVIDM